MRICMLAYTFYESDNRVRRYSEALVDSGNDVDVISLFSDNKESGNAILNGVNVYCIQKRKYDEKNKLDYAIRLSLFFFKALFFLTKKHFSRRYDVVHVHNMPDFLVYCAVVPKIMGAKVILDIHDIFPEFFLSKFKKTERNIFYKIFLLLEKACVKFSDHTIIANHIWEKTLLSRSATKEKCTTILNYPDPKIFNPSLKEKQNDKFILLYPGSLNWHQGLEVAIRAFAKISPKIPEAEFHVYGEGPSKEDLVKLVSYLGLKGKVFFKKGLPLHEIAKKIANSDVGIVPKLANSFGNEAFSTKIFEFMAIGVPVIISDTKIDKFYFNDSVVRFFKSGNVDDLADSMLFLCKDKELRGKIAANAIEFVKDYDWNIKKKDYLYIVDRLCSKNKK